MNVKRIIRRVTDNDYLFTINNHDAVLGFALAVVEASSLQVVCS